MVKILKPLFSDPKEEQIDHSMEVLQVETLAKSSLYYNRKPKKVTASSLIKGFWKMQKEGVNSFRNWALFTGKEVGVPISKQAMANRMDGSTIELVEQVLKVALDLRIDKKWIKTRKKEMGSLLNFFNRIIIHDSTTQQVAEQLYKIVGGNKTKSGPRALMRLQCMFNFTEEKWEAFSIKPYSSNDQSQANFPLPLLQAKDLILRDLGYFVLDSLEQLLENQYVITPYKWGVNLYTPQGDLIDLLKLLRQSKSIDQKVLLSLKSKLPMRLVAKKLSAEQKAKKIKEAKAKAHRDSNHSKDYYELLGYEIYLTNLSSDQFEGNHIIRLYALRWYIETLFKAWKSYFNFKLVFEVRRMNYTRTIISMYLVLIQFVYLTNYIYQYIKDKVEHKEKKQYISIQKFMDVSRCLLYDILSITNLNQLDRLVSQYAQHAVYEKRNQRKNMKQKYQYFNELSQSLT